MALIQFILLVSLLLLSSWSTPTDAAQALCDNGEGVHPCPSVSFTQTQWGLTWRNYTAIGIVGKGVFGPPGAILESLLEGVPALVDYFNGTNAAKAVLERTIPVGVLMQHAGNQTAYMTVFFLPVRLSPHYHSLTARDLLCTITVLTDVSASVHPLLMSPLPGVFRMSI